MPAATYRARVDALTAEAVREVGVLLTAFAPLDMVFGSPGPRAVVTGLCFFLLGILLCSIGLRMERRVVHV